MTSKYVGLDLGYGWKVVGTTSVGNGTTLYVVRNEETNQSFQTYSSTIRKWAENADSFDPTKYRSKSQKQVAGRPKSNYAVAKPDFGTIEDEIKYCRRIIRHVRKCEECLRFNENCDTLERLKKHENHA